MLVTRFNGMQSGPLLRAYVWVVLHKVPLSDRVENKSDQQCADIGHPVNISTRVLTQHHRPGTTAIMIAQHRACSPLLAVHDQRVLGAVVIQTAQEDLALLEGGVVPLGPDHWLDVDDTSSYLTVSA